MINGTAGEVFFLYLNPNRRNEGIGTLLLELLQNNKKKNLMQMNNGCLWQKGIKKEFLSIKQKDLYLRMNKMDTGIQKEKNIPHLDIFVTLKVINQTHIN